MVFLSEGAIVQTNESFFIQFSNFIAQHPNAHIVNDKNGGGVHWQAIHPIRYHTHRRNTLLSTNYYPTKYNIYEHDKGRH